MIIAEFADSVVLGAHIGVSIRTDRVNLQIVPESIAIRASDSVLDEVVVWLSNPEAGRGLVSVEAGPAAFDLHNQVTVEVVLLLDSILNEDVVTLDLIDNVVHDAHIVRTVESVGAIEALVSGATLHIRLMDSTNLMEMNCISTDFETLTDISHLNIGHTAN
jgi:hypothetical protein